MLKQIIRVGCVTCLLAGSAIAQTAGMQSFQGRLKQNGTPVNGNVTLEFRIFDAATNGNQVDVTGDGQVTAADTFTQAGVPASNGLISTKFGPVHPSAFNGNARWLEATITNPAPVTTLPRLEMATAPAMAEQLNRPGTGTGAVFIDGDGNVGIGTAQPMAMLDVPGDAQLGRTGAPGMLNLSNNAGTSSIVINAQPFPMGGYGRLELRTATGGYGVIVQGGDSLSGGGGELSMGPDGSNVSTLRLSGNNGGNGGRISLSNGQPSNQETITLDANVGIGFGDLKLFGPTGNLGSRLEGGGPDRLTLFYENGRLFVRTREDLGTFALYDGQSPNLETITLVGNPGRIGIGVSNPQAKIDIAGTPGVDGIKFPDGTLQTTAALKPQASFNDIPTIVPLTTNWLTLVSTSITLLGPGRLLIVGNASLNDTGGDPDCRFGISDTTNSAPVNSTSLVGTGGSICSQHSLHVSSAGTYTYYFVAKVSPGRQGNISASQISISYFPD